MLRSIFLTGRPVSYAALAAILMLTACGPSEPPRPMTGDPVQACRAGIQEACGILRIQAMTMQQLSRPIPVQPVQVYRSRQANTTCQTYAGNTRCRTDYR